VVRRFVKIVAVGFGSGLVPLMPGTAGTLVGIPLYLLFSRLAWPLWLLSITAFSFLAVFVAGEAEKVFRQRDPSRVVIDEIAGFQFALFAVTPSVMHVIAGFLLFRFFDIAKPFPIRYLDRNMHGGVGVVADDVAAGVFAGIILHFLIRYANV